MSTFIERAGQGFWVANQRLPSLLAFALEVGESQAQEEQERKWVEKLRQFDDQMWPGIGFDLDERFPTVEEKKFWARVYHDVARGVFLRQLGNHENTFWQSSAIGDAHQIAHMLMQAVHEVEIGWYPQTQDKREADEVASRAQ